MPSSKQQEFFSVQILRALAACMVLTLHILPILQLGLWESMNQGVELFFAISGFVMYLSTANRPNGPSAALTFARRRSIRVVPLYWLFLTLYLIEICPAFRGGGGPVPDWRYVLTSYAFGFRKMPGIGWSGDGVQVHWPILTVGWTLTFELFFYACFAIAILLKRSPLWLTPFFFAMAAIGSYSKADWPAMAALLSPRMLSFLGGMLIAWAVPLLGRVPRPVALLGLFPFLCCVLHYRQPATVPQYWLLTGSSNLLLASAVSLETSGYRVKQNLAVRLGDASYSLYLSHVLILHMIAAAIVRTHRVAASSSILFAFCVAGLCLSVSLVIHRKIEMPIVNRLNAYFKGRPILAS